MKDHILIVILIYIYISIVILIYNSTFLYYMCIDHISYTDSATRTYVQDGTCTSLGFHGDYDEPGMRIQTVSRQLLFHCMDTHFLIPCVSLSIVWWCYSHLLAGFIFFFMTFPAIPMIFGYFLHFFPSIFDILHFFPSIFDILPWVNPPISTVGKAKELLLRLPRLQVLDVGRCSWALGLFKIVLKTGRRMETDINLNSILVCFSIF